MWDDWKKNFDTWEDRTAKLFEVALKSPLVLRPAAAALTAGLRAKAAADKLATSMVARLGLPTKVDQERTLHAIHRLESRLMDVEEKLDAERAKNAILVEELAGRDDKALAPSSPAPSPARTPSRERAPEPAHAESRK